MLDRVVKMTIEQVQVVAGDLIGTCQDLDVVLQANGLPDQSLVATESLAALDAYVLLCEGCGWWCDPDEMESDDSANLVCEDCRANK